MNAGPHSWPWYNDRVTTLRNSDHPPSPPAEREADDALNWPPKRIYEYLDGKVWKQDAAKRAAAMLVYNALGRGIKGNAFFVGPTSLPRASRKSALAAAQSSLPLMTVPSRSGICWSMVSCLSS